MDHSWCLYHCHSCMVQKGGNKKKTALCSSKPAKQVADRSHLLFTWVSEISVKLLETMERLLGLFSRQLTDSDWLLSLFPPPHHIFSLYSASLTLYHFPLKGALCNFFTGKQTER